MAIWGLVLSIRSAGLLIASLILLKLRFKNTLITGLTLGAMTGLPLLALGLSLPITILFVTVLVSSFGVAAAGVTYDTALQSLVPRQELSRVASTDDLLSFATVPLSQAMVGPLAELVGAQELLLFCGAGAIALHLLPLLVRDVKQATQN